MARIRSIKPEFFRDAKIKEVGHSAALFFISMWCFADDDGVVRIDAVTRSLEAPVFRANHVPTFIQKLKNAGLIRVCTRLEHALILGWKHQKIDKPRLGNLNRPEIKWVTDSDSTNGRDQSTQGSRIKDQGSDRRGSDRIRSAPALAADTAETEFGLPPDFSDPPPSPHGDGTANGSTHNPDEAPANVLDPEPSPVSKVWHSYRTAYLARYGAAPTWNGKVAGQIKHFLNRVPKDEAPDIAKFFLAHQDGLYVKKMHPVGDLLRDAEKIRTEWLTGRQMTSARAKHSEIEHHMNDQLRRIAEGTL